MKEPTHDDERISALLAGRLEGPEREELLAHLSTDDEDYEVFADTAAILLQAEEEAARAGEAGVQADPPPHREALPPSVTKSARGWPRKTPRWAGTLVLAGLVVLGFMASRGRGASAGDPLLLATRLEHAAEGLPEGRANYQLELASVRGVGDASIESTPASAAQVGALLVDLAVAIEAGDAEDTRSLADQLDAFDPMGGSDLQQIAARAGQPAESSRPALERATERLEDLYQQDRDYLRLGAWTEAAYLAADKRDEAFFRSRDTRTMLRRAERLTRDDPEAQTAVAKIRAALPAEGSPHWDTLKTDVSALLRGITS